MVIQDRRNDDDKWKLDRKIPVAVIVTSFVQMILLVVFITRLDGRVSTLEKADSDQAWQTERIIRMDERMTTLQTSLSEIKEMIRQPSAKR